MNLARSFRNDIKWKQLAISAAIAFIVALAGGLFVQYIKEEAFVFWFNNKSFGTGTESVEQAASDFFNSYYWVPPYILVCFVTQVIASIYLARKTTGRELTNGFALGVICMFLVYQFNLILSVLSIFFSVATCYIVKQNRMKSKGNL